MTATNRVIHNITHQVRQANLESGLANLYASYRDSGMVVSEPSRGLLALPADIVQRVKESLTGDSIRPGGMSFVSTDKRLTLEQWHPNLEWHELSFGVPRLRSLDQALQVLGRFNDRQSAPLVAGRVFRMTNGLQLAIQQQVGWINQEDLAWFVAEKLGVSSSGDTDFGYFTSATLEPLKGYGGFNGGFYGNGVRVLAELGCDLKDSKVRQLLNSQLLIEIDLAGYRDLLPESAAAASYVGIRGLADDPSKPDGLELVLPCPPLLQSSKVIAVITPPDTDKL